MAFFNNFPSGLRGQEGQFASEFRQIPTADRREGHVGTAGPEPAIPAVCIHFIELWLLAIPKMGAGGGGIF